MKIVELFVIAYIFHFGFLINLLVAEANDLYSPNDNVLRLNGNTFKPTVFHDKKNVTYMVQFYNSFCGHCQLFAPIYKELATRVKNWTSIVQVAGIDCSKDENVNTCSANKIDGYPTIYIFPPNAEFDNPKDVPLNLRSINIAWTVDDIEETIVDYVANLTSRSGEHPLVVQTLQPVINDALHDIQRIYPSSTGPDIVNEHPAAQDLMFIVESENSYLGRKLIIEYFRINTKLELRRILLTNQALLKKILTDSDYQKLGESQPLLLRINNLQNNLKAQVLVRGEAIKAMPSDDESERQDFIYNRFKMFFEHYYSVELKEMSNHDTAVRTSEEGKKQELTKALDTGRKQGGELEIFYLVHNDSLGSHKIFAMDILKGVSYMITHEMRIKGDLSPKEFDTVRNMLTILKKFLPLERWDSTLSDFIENFRTRLDENRTVYSKNGVSGQEMKDLLDFSGADAVRLKYNKENWISCFESDRQQKGYTCSLWLIFHSLTVGEYTRSAPVRTRPSLVLTTMRDYITRFLGCTVCSSNFAKETENLESSLVFRNSSVLWLWETHNRVRQRLNNEKQSDKKPLAKVIYPSPEICKECFEGNANQIGVDGKNLENIEWDLPNVLEHLVQIYRPDRLVSPIEMASLLANIKSKLKYDVLDQFDRNKGQFETINRIAESSADMNKSVEQWNLQSIFSTSDMGICLLLYLFSLVILAIVCLSMNPKWKRFKTK